MPIIVKGTSPCPEGWPSDNPYEDSAMIREFFLTDKDGVERRITTQAQLKAILNQMTPEELAKWKDSYRFTPITIDDNIDEWFAGTLRDL